MDRSTSQTVSTQLEQHIQYKYLLYPSQLNRDCGGAWMSHLHLRLFGAPQVELNGVPVALATRKVMALLAYLVITGQAHSRDALATLLWPEADQARARGSLRPCVEGTA
jgi:hypothetical protein